MGFIELAQLKEKEIVSGFHMRIVHSDHISQTFWTVEAGASLPEHSHPHEQISCVVEGELEMTLEGETRILTPKIVAVIPPHAKHGGRALTNCRILDAFYPVREDYK
ncbi:MAG: cupin domain-containing protein [Anaerolineales bacterium]|nr:cupin domain-containing protein [Anaerolineales bacterium]